MSKQDSLIFDRLCNPHIFYPIISVVLFYKPSKSGLKHQRLILLSIFYAVLDSHFFHIVLILVLSNLAICSALALLWHAYQLPTMQYRWPWLDGGGYYRFLSGHG